MTHHTTDAGRKPRNTPENKYRNVVTIVDGLRFASKAEAKRWGDLILLVRGREITELRRQPRYELKVNGHKVCTYVADFAYLDKTGTPVTEDVKGVKTKDFIIKAKLFRALLGREVRLINVRAK